MSKRKYTGVRQRCPSTCPDATAGRRCKKHLWSYQYEAGRDINGKRVVLQGSGYATASDAADARDEAKVEWSGRRVRRVSADDLAVSVQAFLERWIAEKEAAAKSSANTIKSYRQHIEGVLVPNLGTLRLRDLDGTDIDRMLAQLRRAGKVSESTLSRYVATLRAALNDAVRHRLVSSNPVRHVVNMPSSKSTKSLKPWSVQEAHQFLAYCQQHDARMALVVEYAALTGLRRGELCGLKWSDIDLDAGIASVERQLVDLGTEVIESRPKSDAGVRVLALDPVMVAVLRRQKALQAADRLALGAAWTDNGWVFTRADGRFLRPERVSKDFLALINACSRAAEKAGEPEIPRTRFHDLRHLAASLALAGGADMHALSKRLGHSTIRLTTDRYGHLLEAANVDAAARTGQAWAAGK